MDKRYKPIAYVAGGLFVMIAVAQAPIHFGFHDHDQSENRNLQGTIIIQ